MTPKDTPRCGRHGFGGVVSFGPLHPGGGAQASPRDSPSVRGPSPRGMLCALRGQPRSGRGGGEGKVGINAQF